MPGWISGLLANQAITALLGVALGAGIGFGGSVWLSAKQARDAHRAAVRVVVVELTGNSVALAVVREGGVAGKYAAVDTSAYDTLLLPLYSLLPAAVATPVARAYTRLHTFKDKPVILATEEPATVDQGMNALMNYAMRRLKLEFPVPAAK